MVFQFLDLLIFNVEAEVCELLISVDGVSRIRQSDSINGTDCPVHGQYVDIRTALEFDRDGSSSVVLLDPELLEFVSDQSDGLQKIREYAIAVIEDRDFLSSDGSYHGFSLLLSPL